MNLFENYNIKSLQPPTTCNSSMLRVFNVVNGKTIDDSNLPIIPFDIPVNVHQWYRNATILTSIGVGYVDSRDPNNIYIIVIATKSTDQGCPSMCANIPVIKCVDICGVIDVPCIVTMTVTPTNILYTVPNNIIDEAMSVIPIKSDNNMLYIVGGLVGLGLLYIIAKKR